MTNDRNGTDRPADAEKSAELCARARKVELIILDVDGVLTDGTVTVDSEKECQKSFNCRDGLGITTWHRLGKRTAIVTGRNSPPVVYRAKELHISEVYLGTLDKREAYKDLKAKFDLTDGAICYIGDDLIDLPILRQVGFPAAVGDAVDEVKAAAALVAEKPGGRGAVREIIEFILKAQGRWQDVLAYFDIEPKGSIRGISQ